MTVNNEIIVGPDGNATVFGPIAHRLWNYCRGEFPRTKGCHNNFYVMEYLEFPQGFRWDIQTGETTREAAVHRMDSNRVLIDVTNAPRIFSPTA